jgi:hypothetical protein
MKCAFRFLITNEREMTSGELGVTLYVTANCMFMYVYVCLCTATLTEVFPCFSLSCKENARVKPAKTGHGQHSS